MRWAILAFMFFLYVINFADKAIAGYAAVSITEEFGLTPLQWGLVGSSFFWSFVISNIFGSTLSDRLGTRKMITIMAISWTILQFGAFAITNLQLLIAYRILLGIFEGPFFATAIAQLNHWFPAKSRGMATSILNFGGVVGGLVCAPILVYLIETFGWKISFGSLGFVSLLWTILWVWLGKERPDESSEEVAKTPIIKKKENLKEIFSSMFSLTFLVTLFAGFTVYWYLSWIQVWMPSFLIKAKALSTSEMSYVASLTGLLAGLVTISISIFSDYLFKKNSSYRKSRVLVAGFTFFIGAALFYSMTEIHSIVWTIAVLILGKGCLSAVFVMGPHISSSLLPQRTSLMIGTFAGVSTIAGVVGPIVSGKLVQVAGKDIVQGYDNTILMVVVLSIIAGILLIAFAKPDNVVKKKQKLMDESEQQAL
ncbi:MULTISPECIES: MFS transporter [Peribacillus]|uniref:MFS transporter n=1 Tax=Peribacillus TaxID=2675229 RepID=UPI001F4E5258|nr:MULTISPECIES: MFS transporter [unclassified Peribacillus]MCK1983560.1 MFS transporter [Peribacillus sp. Aquil_B1]MCK2006578.1 MFS transporter [Peribacillus sp. Aquil_B8]